MILFVEQNLLASVTMQFGRQITQSVTLGSS
jgi:hypothetical protein